MNLVLIGVNSTTYYKVACYNVSTTQYKEEQSLCQPNLPLHHVDQLERLVDNEKESNSLSKKRFGPDVKQMVEEMETMGWKYLSVFCKS